MLRGLLLKRLYDEIEIAEEDRDIDPDYFAGYINGLHQAIEMLNELQE